MARFSGASEETVRLYIGVARAIAFVMGATFSLLVGQIGIDDPQVRALAQKYARFVAEEEFAAWISTLKEKFPVEIHKAALEAARER
jgi:hypothetical protein